jgi:radical SAM family uncharacterized protein
MRNLCQRVTEQLLPFVRQPGQYIGGEINSIVREPDAPGGWNRADVRIALAFPDTYALGMSHLGSAILYHIANRTSGVVCERVFSPWLDAERVMREKHIPLFTWETRQPVSSADVLAISVQYEMHFANVLNLLDLAGMAVRHEERFSDCGLRIADCKENSFRNPKSEIRNWSPLVVAGGPQADNPEPLADFIDLFVIGDGEPTWPAIIEAVREAKRAGRSKRDLLIELARRHEWAYVPSLYDVQYKEDGTVASVMRSPPLPGPPPAGEGAMVRRARVIDFDAADYPAEQIVPWTQAVHERITLELMRGCPNGCRFCHAGYTKRPIVWRSVQCLLDQAERAYRATGFSEIALTSLSTSDYPHLAELLIRLRERFGPRHVSISVPSLRVDKQLELIPQSVSDVRKSGLTIAVEAAREPLRQRIGKRVSDSELLAGVRAAYAAGWRSVKLYFMVGFPGETEDDIRGIIELAKRVAWARREVCSTGVPPVIHGQDAHATSKPGPASVTVSVSPLVPKPHTPFQWAGQRDGGYFRWARNLLRDLAARSPVQVKFHRIERSLLEAVFARGDRRLGRAIEIAWRAGARFDAWEEGFDYDRWMRALAQAGLDPAFYAQRARPFDEVLPWDHIESGTPRAALLRLARSGGLGIEETNNA